MKKTILIATKNKHKVEEIKNIFKNSNLKDFEIISLSESDEDVEENGKTFKENAYIKASYFSKKYPEYIVIADDSGLMVNALNGAPGIYSRRYAGPDATDHQNRVALLKRLEHEENRIGLFSCCVCLIANDISGVHYFNGETVGYILKKEDGKNGFGYDSIFYSYELNKSFAQATLEEKERVSHRGKAIKNLVECLELVYGKKD